MAHYGLWISGLIVLALACTLALVWHRRRAQRATVPLTPRLDSVAHLDDQQLTDYLTGISPVLQRVSELSGDAQIQYIREQAQAGEPYGEFLLASLYFSGRDSLEAPDHDLARYWFERSAAQGVPAAMYFLGTYYHMGLGGVDEDSRRAAEWMGKAAALGHTKSMYLYGRMLVEGYGCDTPNTAEGLSWLRKARQKGSKKAAAFLANPP